MVRCVCRESLVFGCDTQEPVYQTVYFLLEYFVRLDLKHHLMFSFEDF